MPEHELHLTVGSRFENVELVQAAIDEAIAARGADEDARHWVGLAVREAVANAIKHGNRQDPDKRVDVAVLIDSEAVEIAVADEGSGFDPSTVRDPLAPENLFRTNGRGIFYMRRFMDEVSYGSTASGGTLVRLRKRFAAERTNGQGP
ncbi:MAG TPA: ATP-binding protein [Thermoanaerobaculia bacterium]|jgi:serine/threonine-protein kinase RsbW